MTTPKGRTAPFPPRIAREPRGSARGPGRRAPRGSYHHGNLREALLDAAERALDRGAGADELSLRGIARGAGVTHAAAYHHFADREALLRAVAARGFERFAAALVQGARAAAGPHAFLEMGVAYVRFAAGGPGLFRLMFGGEIARGRARDAALRGASDAAFAVLLAGVRQADARASDEAVRRRAVAAWSIVHGLASLLLEGQLTVAGYSLDEPERAAREVLGSGAAE
jgi:AcrR family transcriptional regulator